MKSQARFSAPHVALVTGASSGIGAATAVQFGKWGSHVAVHYHKNRDAALEIVKNIEGSGVQAEAFQADLSKRDFVDASETLRLPIVAQTTHNWGRSGRSVPVTDLPVTDLPVTDLPVTDLPVTDLPVTDLPVTDLPVTDLPFPRLPRRDNARHIRYRGKNGVPRMTVSINLPPETEKALKAQAKAQGLSVEDWLLRLAERAAEQPATAKRQFDNLSDLLLASPLAGADLNLERSQDHPRPTKVE